MKVERKMTSSSIDKWIVRSMDRYLGRWGDKSIDN